MYMYMDDMDVSLNGGTPKSPISIGFIHFGVHLVLETPIYALNLNKYQNT